MINKKISIILSAAIIGTAATGCSLYGEPTPTPEPAAEAETIYIAGEYGLLEGYDLYTSPDSIFSIQLPQGSAINDNDSMDVTVTIPSSYENADMLNISRTPGMQEVHEYSELKALTGDDVDITNFYILNMDGEYRGYKYAYSSKDSSDINGIVSVYYGTEGSAYTVNAIINNGADEENVKYINNIVDTFILYI